MAEKIKVETYPGKPPLPLPCPGLSRDFVIRAILKLLDEAETGKKWGAVQVTYQNGNCKTIKKEETITSETDK